MDKMEEEINCCWKNCLGSNTLNMGPMSKIDGVSPGIFCESLGASGLNFQSKLSH